MRYAEIAVELDAEGGQRLVEELVSEGIAVEERDATTLLKAPPGRVLVITWAEEGEAEERVAELEDAMRRLGIAAELRRKESDEDDWRDAWKRFFEPRSVGPFAIVPSWWRGYERRPGETVITLEPGRAFGTGGHASTRLMLEAIGRLPLPARVLDVGCGSGILDVACALRDPAVRCIAIDVDPDSAAVTRENAEENGVVDRIEASTTPLSEVAGAFDLVLANIQADVLLSLAADLVRVTGRHLVLGGVLVEQGDAVSAAFAARGMRERERLAEDGWCAIAMEPGAR